MVIDVFGDIPLPETLRYRIRDMGKLEGYFEIFARGFARMCGLGEEEFERMKGELPCESLVEKLIEKGISNLRPISEYLRDFENVGLLHMCIYGDDAEFLARLARTTNNLFLGFIDINPHGKKIVETIRSSILDFKLHGVMLVPYKHKIYPNSSIIMPIYRECEKLGVPIWIHCSINWWKKATIDYGRPIHLDKVAASFPKLKIIAGHGGWPWVNELIAIAWRHKNLYIDTSAHRPKFLSTPGSGWEMLMHFGNSVLQNKVLFGSGWTFLGMPLSKVVEEFQRLPLSNGVKEKWLYRNAQILLKL